MLWFRCSVHLLQRCQRQVRVSAGAPESGGSPSGELPSFLLGLPFGGIWAGLFYLWFGECTPVFLGTWQEGTYSGCQKYRPWLRCLSVGWGDSSQMLATFLGTDLETVQLSSTLFFKAIACGLWPNELREVLSLAVVTSVDFRQRWYALGCSGIQSEPIIGNHRALWGWV